jgi:xanthine dehydrogenase accessory factor
MRNLYELIVLIKGAGEVASGVAHRLHRSHLKVCMTEINFPLAVSRGTCFSEAVRDGTKTIEGVTCEHVSGSLPDINHAWTRGRIPVVVDPEAMIRFDLKPDVIVDATMTKKQNVNMINDAPLVIGLGPGFHAGRDVHLVIETYHGNNLGRVIDDGEALKDNRLPVAVGGLGKERVIWAEHGGLFTTDKSIGEYVDSGEIIAYIGSKPVRAPLKGWLRGLLRSNVTVSTGAKLVEVDHINPDSVACDIRDKMRSIAGGVLEAIMIKSNIKSHDLN